MKIKKIISLVVLALFIVSSSMQGQGIYSSKEKKGTNGGIYRAPGGGVGGEEVPGGGEGKEAPIGDGLLILTLMAGGYFIAKMKKNKKE
jgi:hypothetical protein